MRSQAMPEKDGVRGTPKPGIGLADVEMRAHTKGSEGSGIYMLALGKTRAIASNCDCPSSALLMASAPREPIALALSLSLWEREPEPINLRDDRYGLQHLLS